MSSQKNIIILGGLGFIGSNVANMLGSNNQVLIFDNLDKDCGGSLSNIITCQQSYYLSDVCDLSAYKNFFECADIIIDCVGWTDHGGGQFDPEKDRRLNFETHAAFLKFFSKLNYKPTVKLIYLGSISEFGNVPKGKIIGEEDPLFPSDFQGVHKFASERYFSIYSTKLNISVLNLRLPAVFGKNMYKTNKELGLVGSMIFSGMRYKIIEVFGLNRERSVASIDYINDIISVVLNKEWLGFKSLNIPGRRIKIQDLAQQISVHTNAKIDNIDIPSQKKIPIIDNCPVQFDDKVLVDFLETQIEMHFEYDLLNTINYFKEVAS
jgi:nucleoside-diphosphate-sugar epimerase